MSQGTIFDIKEFSVHDGPGVRVTVFFKGCPLRCIWCHNPEGLNIDPQVMRSFQGCDHCQKCAKPCTHPDCKDLKHCTKICPHGLIRKVGESITTRKLIERLEKFTPTLSGFEGGVTLSGGEPLMQPQFLLDLLQNLTIHTAIQTCGHCDSQAFGEAINLANLVMFDIKLLNPAKHKMYTGVDNDLILKNLKNLKSSGKFFTIRLPIIPGINDNKEHFIGVAELLKDSKNQLCVEVLPFNPLAGAKYPQLDMTFEPKYELNTVTQFHVDVLKDAGLTVSIL